MSKYIDLTEKIFGRLIVIRRMDNDKCGNRRWLCGCDCEQTIIALGSNLCKKQTKSCGCLQKELLASRSTKHGHRKNRKTSQIYASWQSMIQRCFDSHNPAYSRYGGRGIEVHKQWNKFENFLKDMGEPPTKNHSIDRIDNNGNYCKSNCRWATRKEQGRNKKNNRLITFIGRTQCLSAWAEQYDILRITLTMRLKRGWSIGKALITPVGNQGIRNNAR